MTVAASIDLAGHRLMLDPAGALWWPEQGLLAVADLHFEKGSACAMRGHLIPPWDTRATLERLAVLLQRYSPKIVLALGDSFHDNGGASRLMAADSVSLAAMAASHQFVWLLGNHDPLPPDNIGGVATESWGMWRTHIPASGCGSRAGDMRPPSPEGECRDAGTGRDPALLRGVHATPDAAGIWRLHRRAGCPSPGYIAAVSIWRTCIPGWP